MRKKITKTYLKKMDEYPSLNMFFKPLTTNQGFPIVYGTQFVPEYLITYNSFTESAYKNYSQTYPDRKNTISFFTDDYRFGSVWSHAQRLSVKLSKYHSLLSPDFTLSFEFPDPVNRWQHYRKQWVSSYWQSQGLIVIPVVNWLGEDSFEWCFEGMPMNSTIAISTNEISTDDEFDYFNRGLLETIKRLSPTCVICYGTRWMKEMAKIDFNAQIIFYRASNGWKGRN